MLMTRTLLAMTFIASLAIGCGGDDTGTNVDDPDTSVTDPDAGDTDVEDPDSDVDDPDTDVEDPDVEDPDTDVDPVEEFGAVSVTVEGLPDGAWPEITLSGDEGDVIIGDEGLVEDLAVGDYEISAAPFTLELATYEAVPVELTIEADQTTDVTLSFELILASLDVTIEGLPEGVDAFVEIIGDEGTDELTESTTLIDLVPGTYSVLPGQITAGDVQYEADASTLDLASGDAQTLTVTYVAVPGELLVDVEGLPGGIAPFLTVTGPEGFEESALRGDTLEDLTLGSYTLSGTEVEAGLDVYRAAPVSGDVVSLATTELTLSYALVPGQLEIVVEGLPAGVDPDLTLTNPEGVEADLTQAGTLVDQMPGTYTLTANDVTAGPAIYRADAGGIVEVSSEQTATLTVSYVVVPGDLQISASGLPSGADLNANLVGPAPSTDTVSIAGEQTLEDLAPGSYTLSIDPVNDGDVIFNATPASLEVTVNSEQVSQATIAYEAVPGTVTLSHEFPGTGSLTVQVSDGLGFTQNVTLSGTGSRSIELDPGSYELTLAANGLGTDAFGNAYSFIDGIDVGFSISSDQTVTRALSAPSPTEVTRGDDNGRGSLREVVNRVVAGSVVTFADGVSEITTASLIVIGKELSIVGPGPDALTLSVSGIERVFSFGPGADVHLEGLRIGDITIGGTGGAIYNLGTFSLRDVVFENIQLTDSDADGGAIAIAQSTAEIVIEDTLFLNNQADQGGAINIDLIDHDVVLNRVRFEGNSAASDGGAINSEASLIVADAIFTSNTAGFAGGAIYQPLRASNASEFERALFANNTAVGRGGAVYSGVDSTLLNVTFSNNSSDEFGGGYYQYDGDTTMSHITFANNVAPTGSALASFCDSATSVQLKSSIVVGDGTLFHCAAFSPPFENPTLSLGNNYVETDAPGFFTPDTTTDQIGTTAAPLVDPLLALADNGGFSQTNAVDPLSINELSISQSLCTDAAGQPVTEDQRAEARPTNGFCTAGAFQATADGANFEPFHGNGLSASTYATTTFTTTIGFTWDVNGVRSEGSYPIAGEGLMFRQVGDYVRSVGLSGGVDEISVDYRKAFSADAARQIAVAVNGTVVATSPVFGDFTGTDDSVFTLTASDLNISGDFTIEIRNLTPANGQVVIDNLSWL